MFSWFFFVLLIVKCLIVGHWSNRLSSRSNFSTLQPHYKVPQKDAKQGKQQVKKSKVDREESASSTEEEDSSRTEASAESSGGEVASSNKMLKSTKTPTIKIVSWNVNGIRAWLQKNGLDYLKREQPDIFVVQETKCGEEAIPKEAKQFPGYHTYWESTNKKGGYAGVGLFSKQKPINVSFGMGIAKHDEEGRLVTAEYDKFYLIAAYVPNSGRGLVRLQYRQEWNTDFLKYISDLDAKKPVIYTGDLNVAHKEIDLKNPKTNTKTAGFTKEERADFTELLQAGFIDSFRYLYPDKTDAYSFWTYMGNARARNIGWRLDYFVLSNRLVKYLCDSVIQEQIQGSDHCPICLHMAL